MTMTEEKTFSPNYFKLVREFPLRRIKTRKDARAATRILDRLASNHYDDAGVEAYVEVLMGLLGDYEDEHDTFESSSTGLDLLRHVIAESGTTQSQLGNLLGITQAAASMILRGEREITASHARALGKRFSLDAGAFL